MGVFVALGIPLGREAYGRTSDWRTEKTLPFYTVISVTTLRAHEAAAISQSEPGAFLREIVLILASIPNRGKRSYHALLEESRADMVEPSLGEISEVLTL